AFVSRYFAPVQGRIERILLLENKLMAEAERVSAAPRPRHDRPGQPWRIGWFGILRGRPSPCNLAPLGPNCPGAPEGILRGRRAYTELVQFDALVAATPNLSYGGPYEQDELAELYAGIDFCWAMDWFDEGRNSDWLLPNRLYESLRHETPLLARAHTEL